MRRWHYFTFSQISPLSGVVKDKLSRRRLVQPPSGRDVSCRVSAWRRPPRPHACCPPRRSRRGLQRRCFPGASQVLPVLLRRALKRRGFRARNLVRLVILLHQALRHIPAWKWLFLLQAAVTKVQKRVVQLVPLSGCNAWSFYPLLLSCYQGERQIAGKGHQCLSIAVEIAVSPERASGCPRSAWTTPGEPPHHSSEHRVGRAAYPCRTLRDLTLSSVRPETHFLFIRLEIGLLHHTIKSTDCSL